MSKFKIGNLNLETFETIIFDLEMLSPKKSTISQRYNFELLKGNIEDLFGFYTKDKFYNPKMNIKEISKKDFNNIINSKETRFDKYFPFGKFWLKEKNIYIGIDNSTGEAFTEEFKTKRQVLNWL